MSNTNSSLNKIKIVHLTSVHSFQDTRIFWKECISLANAGYEVSLVAPCSQEAPTSISNVNFIAFPKAQNRFMRMLWSTWLVYKTALTVPAALYHFHDPELIPVGILLKIFHGKKIIYDVHEDLPKQILSKNWIPERLRYAIAYLMEKVESFGAKIFDALVTATPGIENRFKNKAQRTENINNYPILSEFSSVVKIRREKKENAVCYVGGISDIRGIFEIVEAIAPLNVNLLLAGKFVGDDTRKSVEKTPGWNRVVELGYVNRNQVAETLEKSVAGLVTLHPVPNYLDSQPVKMFEYMAAGLPVIASNFPLWRQIVEGNNCGICVDPLNSAEISQAIQWILDNPEQAQEMGRNGYKAVVEKYNWDVEAVKLKKLYQDLLQ